MATASFHESFYKHDNTKCAKGLESVIRVLSLVNNIEETFLLEV